MKRVFKSDAEIDLNRCANALEKLVKLMESSQERGLVTKKESSPERGLTRSEIIARSKPRRKPQDKYSISQRPKAKEVKK